MEKEYAQAAGDASPGSTAPVETEQLRNVLLERGNEYLARQLCWVFSVRDVDVFTISCTDDALARRLVEALPTGDNPESTVQAVVGTVTGIGRHDPCYGSEIPSVSLDQLLSFSLAELVEAIVTAGQADGEEQEDDQERSRAVVRDLFTRLTHRSYNWGLNDEHRALNYVALRYPPLYWVAVEAITENKILLGVETRRAPSGARTLIAVRLTFRARRTDLVERYECLVDVSDRFPFLAAPISAVHD